MTKYSKLFDKRQMYNYFFVGAHVSINMFCLYDIEIPSLIKSFKILLIKQCGKNVVSVVKENTFVQVQLDSMHFIYGKNPWAIS